MSYGPETLTVGFGLSDYNAPAPLDISDAFDAVVSDLSLVSVVLCMCRSPSPSFLRYVFGQAFVCQFPLFDRS